jgi:hypothetical protein
MNNKIFKNTGKISEYLAFQNYKWAHSLIITYFTVLDKNGQ